jgi:hypothetical protein
MNAVVMQVLLGIFIFLVAGMIVAGVVALVRLIADAPVGNEDGTGFRQDGKSHS